MTTTNTIGKLAGALAAAQGEILGAPKSSLNPHFKSRYADLAEVWGACREALSKHKIAVIQAVQSSEDGASLWLETILAHESGETAVSRFPLRPTKPDMQGLGSAISYARRYALSAMVGVVSEQDDDCEAAIGRGGPYGNQASGRSDNAVQTQRPVGAPFPNLAPQTPPEARPNPAPSTQGRPVQGFDPNNTDHIKALMAVCTKQGVTGKWLNAVITAMRGRPQSELEAVIKQTNPELTDGEP